MLDLRDINEIKHGKATLLNKLAAYIEEKNLNFIVAGGELLNKRYQALGSETVQAYLTDYARCDFSKISVFNEKPTVPFMAVQMDDADFVTGRVKYLIDFNEEATQGTASPFYSKMLGAFATNLFAVEPRVQRLWFPFAVQNLVGSNMKIQTRDSGTFILKSGV